MKAPAVPTPHPSDADAVQADPDVLPVYVYASGFAPKWVFHDDTPSAAAPVVDFDDPAPATARKRMGRPPTNGTKPAVAIVRALEVLKHFEEARLTLGHTDSIAATVKAVKAKWPGMKGLNTAEVKRVLTTCQPVGRALAFRVRPNGNGGALYVGSRPAKRTYLG